MELPDWWVKNWGNKPYAIADCVSGMKIIPDGVVDLVIADPPYGVNYVSTRYKKGNPHGAIVKDKEFDFDFNVCWLAEAQRVMAENSAVFVFCSYPVIRQWLDLVEEFFEVRNLIVWMKNHWSAGDLEGNFGNQYEFIICAVKGNPKLRGHRWSNIWKFDREPSEGHPTIKPAPLCARMIKSLCPVNGVVLDPFLGSGTTLLAARMECRIAVGFEIEQKYAELIERRSSMALAKIETFVEGEHGNDGDGCKDG